MQGAVRHRSAHHDHILPMQRGRSRCLYTVGSTKVGIVFVAIFGAPRASKGDRYTRKQTEATLREKIIKTRGGTEQRYLRENVSQSELCTGPETATATKITPPTPTTPTTAPATAPAPATATTATATATEIAKATGTTKQKHYQYQLF